MHTMYVYMYNLRNMTLHQSQHEFFLSPNMRWFPFDRRQLGTYVHIYIYIYVQHLCMVRKRINNIYAQRIYICIYVQHICMCVYVQYDSAPITT